MDSRRIYLLALNIVGGSAVLISYALGLSSVPGEVLWGGVPEAIRPFYTLNMFLAAAGYFLFTPYILFRLDPDATLVGGRFSYRIFHVLYALVLFPSALWIPLTAYAVSAADVVSWALVVFDLALVAIGSVGLLLSVLNLNPEAARGHWVAAVGLVPFCIQTALLDALVWPICLALYR